MKAPLLFLVVLLTAFFGCQSRQTPSPETKQVSNTIAVTDLAPEPDSVVIEPEEESCIFDQETQTSEFLDTLPNFHKFVWIDSIKTAIVPLSATDTLFLERGGCTHFYYVMRLHSTSSHSAKDIKHWVNQLKLHSDAMNDAFDFGHVFKLYESGAYSTDLGTDQVFLDFKQDQYCSAQLWIEEDARERIVAQLMQYLC